MMARFITPEEQKASRKKLQEENNRCTFSSYRLPLRPSTPTKPMPPIPLPVRLPAGEEKSNVVQLHPVSRGPIPNKEHDT